MNDEKYLLEIEQDIHIAAPPESVFEGVIARLTTKSRTPDETPMPMTLERRPGGRWFRDLGDETGHLWGFVQVIKPPKLLELHGPLFMSYPVTNHVSFRCEEASGGTKLILKHRAFGLIDDHHREGVTSGWSHFLQDIKAISE